MLTLDIHKLQQINFRDDSYLNWSFYVSDEFVNLAIKNIDAARTIISEFYKDYFKISTKYSLGEIFPTPLKKSIDIDVEQLYLDLSKRFEHENDTIGFFPLHNTRKMITYPTKFTRLHPSACKYVIPTSSNQFEEDYFYINRNGVRKLDSLNYYKLPLSQDNFEITGYGTKYDNLLDDPDIGFSISIYSEFWFQKTFGKSHYNIENRHDNSLLAYHNTPRLNSYIRDLRDVWVNKYQWNIDFEGWYDTNEEGILLDGKIIYQKPK